MIDCVVASPQNKNKINCIKESEREERERGEERERERERERESITLENRT